MFEMVSTDVLVTTLIWGYAERRCEHVRPRVDPLVPVMLADCWHFIRPDGDADRLASTLQSSTDCNRPGSTPH
jgi:hypothetical protein